MNRKLLLKIVKAISTRATEDARKGRMDMPEDIADDADLAEIYRDEYVAAVHALPTP